jgi:hypothetical protein
MSIALNGSQRQTYWALRSCLTCDTRQRFGTKKGEVDKRQRASISLQYRSSVAVNSPNPFLVKAEPTASLAGATMSKLSEML